MTGMRERRLRNSMRTMVPRSERRITWTNNRPPLPSLPSVEDAFDDGRIDGRQPRTLARASKSSYGYQDEGPRPFENARLHVEHWYETPYLV